MLFLHSNMFGHPSDSESTSPAVNVNDKRPPLDPHGLAWPEARHIQRSRCLYAHSHVLVILAVCPSSCRPSAEFSLNNKEPIDSSCSLRAAGIGPGDLLFVLDGTQKTASGPTRAPTDASSAVVSRRVTDPITAALLPRLGTELAAVSLCVSAVGPNPEEYRAAAVFVACHAVLTQAGLTAVQGNAWPDRWWAAPHCGYGKHYVHPHLPGAASTVRCVSFGSVFVLSAIAMSDGQGEKDTSPPSRPHVLVAQIEPTKYVRVVPSRGTLLTPYKIP